MTAAPKPLPLTDEDWTDLYERLVSLESIGHGPATDLIRRALDERLADANRLASELREAREASAACGAADGTIQRADVVYRKGYAAGAHKADERVAELTRRVQVMFDDAVRHPTRDEQEARVAELEREVERQRKELVIADNRVQTASRRAQDSRRRMEIAEQDGDAALAHAEAAAAEVERLRDAETAAEGLVDAVHDLLWDEAHRGETVLEMAVRVKARAEAAESTLKRVATALVLETNKELFARLAHDERDEVRGLLRELWDTASHYWKDPTQARDVCARVEAALKGDGT